MIPHEKAMVDRLKDKPFALVGINSDGDRAVSKTFEAKEKEALASLGSEATIVEQIRVADPAFLAKVEAASPGLVDMAPTVLSALGIETRDGAEGRALIE